MDDVLRQRLWRHIEALPEDQVYQVLDYIEFLSSKYNRQGVRAVSSVQRFGERLQDRMRAHQVGVRAIRGTLEAVGTADRVFSGLAEAGRSLMREVDAGRRTETTPRAPSNLPALPKPSEAERTPESARPGPEPRERI